MTRARPAVLLLVPFLLSFCSVDTAAQRVGALARVKPQVLSLSFGNNGQHLVATVGQQIEISLGTIGPRQYGTPEISSPAIRLLNTALDWPPNPGGPGFVYVFEAANEGEARVRVPVINCEAIPYTNDITFTVMISVTPVGKRGGLQAMMTPDQSNTATWRDAWTNLNNSVRQTFTPSLPRLTAVEVDLVVANPGADSATVSMMIGNAEGLGLAFLSKQVDAADCAHVVFIFPRGGLRVSPGQVYTISLRGGDNLFGWKYVVGGYRSGAAWLNNKPLLGHTRSTFLFRTFGRS